MSVPGRPANLHNIPAQVAASQGDEGPARLGRADWYKDAIIYQLHVKAFQDATGDGLGDFKGLMQRLDYIERLGVNTIWLLPFYPSPLRDDGYDIAAYKAINNSYGKMGDFKRFVKEAHRRGISVITELVINHTSDQHPWFQRARKAKRGSKARDFYVWSDTDEKYSETRIIFLDTERSNWTWDPVAGQYFWHRFYSHQPDLNFDNPEVLEKVIDVMRFWLGTGVDGLRLDAIPYLIERDGTNNENLPETHGVLKKIRAALDAEFPDRMLLAEANQWPEDTRPYFGDGDECHMAFHFPLMPRMYMAVAQEDRHPVTDILRQTPEIPDHCQWAIFLRNHDELTLEMVTDKERDYLWSTFASDRRARINLGIRRRLAPLMQNDRRKIEFMNALLLSMPGTPVIYYGDELGMGDNIYLGDRDGVRTPMQWSADRNGGFSRADPQALYLPAIMDPVYGYQAINVEAQQADPSSLLNWIRRMISVRKQHDAFGRGTLELLYPRNRKIFAYIRSHKDETILCVANLSRSAQAVELDLSAYRSRVPVELIGRSPFPPIGELPYMLTLPGYGFYWFLLASEAELPDWHLSTPETLPEFLTLTIRRGNVDDIFKGREARQLTTSVLPEFLQRQRWFGAKDSVGGDIAVERIAGFDETQLAAVRLTASDGEEHRYFLPLSVLWGEENVQYGAPLLPYTLARVRTGPRLGALVDATRDERLTRELVTGMQRNAVEAADDGRLIFHGTEDFVARDAAGPVKPLAVEQSNVSIALGATLLKIYRRLRSGVQPEIEIARFLTEEARYANTPAYLGSLEHESADGTRTVLATAFDFVTNQGDAWGAVVHALDRELEAAALARMHADGEPVDVAAFGYPLDLIGKLGQRTGELHAALATETDTPGFGCRPIGKQDLKGWVGDLRTQAKQAFRNLERSPAVPDEERDTSVVALLERRDEIEAAFQQFAEQAPAGVMSRAHGDYHLGQVLLTQDDLLIIDFEGEPRRSLEDRRALTSPLRDVAGMLRSFDYAAWTALDALSERYADLAPALVEIASEWRRHATATFLDGWRNGIGDAPTRPTDGEGEGRLLDLFLLQKAFYEINYEAANRPVWVGIPVRGVLDLIEGKT